MIKNRSGLSLIEILAAIVLFSYIALTISSIIRGVNQSKNSIEKVTGQNLEVRAIYSIFERDIKRAIFVTPELLGWDPQDPYADEDDGSNNDTDDEAATEDIPPPPPVTLFKGERNYLIFTAASHQRMNADAPENEQHIVSYLLDDDELIRTESSRAISADDYDNSDQFRKFTVIDNVKSLEFKYWDDKKEKWTDEWDTDKADTVNKLPLAVQVLITYTSEELLKQNPKAKARELSFNIPITQPMINPGRIKNENDPKGGEAESTINGLDPNSIPGLGNGGGNSGPGTGGNP